MTLWHGTPSIEAIHARFAGTAMDTLDIRITEIGPDFLRGAMPVDKRHIQPFGLLHGGVSLVLSETLGSTAAKLAAPPDRQIVGLEINANHLAAVREGEHVTGICRAFHIGRTTQVWQTEITRPDGKLSCVSRLTVAVLPPR